MTTLSSQGTLAIGDAQIEYRMIGSMPDGAPTLVLLHEGLGCAALWGDFPQRLADVSGCGVFVYSRAGYGASSPAPMPRGPDYMHVEALEVLPRILDAIGFKRGFLVGHSDGASIAAIYAGGIQDHRVRGVALMAPHFVMEEMNLKAIAKTRDDYLNAGLRAKLARWHQHVDNAFHGWNDTWLNSQFRDWDISEYLAYIRVPVAIIQGTHDQYGTDLQIAIAQEECYCPVDVTLISGAGHSLHREVPSETLAALGAFTDRILRVHESADRAA